MTNVAVVLASLNVGGAEARMMDILRNIDKKRFHINFIVLNTEPNQFYEAEAIYFGANIIKLDSPRSIGMLRHFTQLMRTYTSGRYTVVHANTSYHCGMALLAAKCSGVRIRIAHARTDQLRHRSLKNRIVAVLGKLLIAFCATDKLAISGNSAAFLFGSMRDVAILPDAIETEKFCNPDSLRIARTIAKYQLNDKTIIGHVGRFDRAKNQEFLIRVFVKYCKSHTDSVLVLIGDGDLIKECKKTVSELGIKDKVLFLGVRSDVDIWMNIFHVFVFPSIYEGLGNAAVEAQAAGIPCLCSDAVPRDVDMELGLVKYLSLNDEISTWCDAIEKMKNTPKAKPDQIMRAFQRRKYTISNAVELLKTIYEGC